jgi:hypothetical protein
MLKKTSLKCFTFDESHRIARTAVRRFRQTIERHDAGVLKAGSDLSFGAKPTLRLGIVGILVL